MMWRHALVAVVLVVGLYWSHVQSAGWVYEDGKARQASAGVMGVHRPLTALTWRVIDTPQRAHLLSLGLHLAVVGLAGLFAWRIGFSGATVGLLVLMTALHPMTVETVAYAAARSELLAAIGLLFAMVCAAGAWWRPWPALGMAVGLVWALLSKETAIIGLIMIPLTWWLQHRTPPVTAWLYGLVLLWLAGVAAWAAIGLPSISSLLTLGGSMAWQTTVAHLPDWAFAQSAAAGRLLWSSVTLTGFTVDADIDSIGWGMRILAVYALLGVGWLAWHLRRTHAGVTFGLTWMLAAILPRLLVQTPRSYLNEHQFYFPFLGLVFAGVAYWDAKVTA